MAKDKHIPPTSGREFAVVFEGDPENNKIICRRFRLTDGEPGKEIIYSQYGIKPHRPHLTKGEQASWNAACKAVGWGPRSGEPVERVKRRLKAFKDR